jgi:hypothetical protein
VHVRGDALLGQVRAKLVAALGSNYEQVKHTAFRRQPDHALERRTIARGKPHTRSVPRVQVAQLRGEKRCL